MVAIHEASHAVVGALVGCPAVLAQLSRAGNWGSTSVLWAATNDVPAPLAEAATLLAGQVADVRFCVGLRGCRLPRSYTNDHAKARVALSRPGVDPGEQLIEIQLWVLRALDRYWPSVEEIAVELLRTGYCFRPEIEAAVAAPTVEAGAIDRWIAEQDVAALTADIRSNPRRWRRPLAI